MHTQKKLPLFSYLHSLTEFKNSRFMSYTKFTLILNTLQDTSNLFQSGDELKIISCLNSYRSVYSSISIICVIKEY